MTWHKLHVSDDKHRRRLAHLRNELVRIDVRTKRPELHVLLGLALLVLREGLWSVAAFTSGHTSSRDCHSSHVLVVDWTRPT